MTDTIDAQRLPLDNIAHKKLSQMYDYWLSKCDGRPMPGRGDIDPMEFTWILGLVCILDVERDPLVFRYRLDGTGVASALKSDMTGKTSDEVEPEIYAKLLREHFTETMETGEASLYGITMQHDFKKSRYLRLALPLSGDDGTVVSILTASAIPPDLEAVVAQMIGNKDGD